MFGGQQIDCNGDITSGLPTASQWLADGEFMPIDRLQW